MFLNWILPIYFLYSYYLLLSLGFKISSNEYPKNVNPKTRKITHNPAGTKNHQAPILTAPDVNAPLRICPQLGTMGFPNPKKLKVVSVSIAVAVTSMVLENTKGNTLGNICLIIIYPLPAPTDIALSMKGLSFIDKV